MLFLMILVYSEYCYILPFLLIFINMWVFFIKSNFFNVKIKTLSSEKIKPANVIKKTHFSIYIKYVSIQLIFFFLFFFVFKGYVNSFFWNQFCINNTNVLLTQLALVLLVVIILLLNSLISNNINYSLDFFFSISNIIVFMILLNFTNNLLSFVFTLELNSILLFYKFVSSRYWYVSNKNIEDKKSDEENRPIPQNYLNMLFFQYWSTFFSSILLFFSLTNFYLLYGSTEFSFINIFNRILLNNSELPNSLLMFIWIPFFIGFFIKIGLTPFHLFKVEVYKGLPIVTLLFYTTFYFFIYFTSFLMIVNYNLNFVKICLNSFFYIFIFFGTIYIIVLMFDIAFLKSFFAYSTIINGLLFFTASYLF